MLILAVGAMALVLVVFAVVVVGIRQGPSEQEPTRQAPSLSATLARRMLGVFVRRPDPCVISGKQRGTGTARNTGDDGAGIDAKLGTLLRVVAALWCTRLVRPAVEQADLAAIAQHTFGLMLRNTASDGLAFADPGDAGDLSIPGYVIALLLPCGPPERINHVYCPSGCNRTILNRIDAAIQHRNRFGLAVEPGDGCSVFVPSRRVRS
jgi:hypothetical protein